MGGSEVEDDSSAKDALDRTRCGLGRDNSKRVIIWPDSGWHLTIDKGALPQVFGGLEARIGHGRERGP